MTNPLFTPPNVAVMPLTAGCNIEKWALHCGSFTGTVVVENIGVADWWCIHGVADCAGDDGGHCTDEHCTPTLQHE
jgi:hypothetical protein